MATRISYKAQLKNFAYMEMSKKRPLAAIAEACYANNVSAASPEDLCVMLQNMGCSSKTTDEIYRLKINGAHWKQICMAPDAPVLVGEYLFVNDTEVCKQICRF